MPRDASSKSLDAVATAEVPAPFDLRGGVESRHAAKLISQCRKGALNAGEPAMRSPARGMVTVAGITRTRKHQSSQPE